MINRTSATTIWKIAIAPAIWYNIYSPALSNTEPIISVAQCTPEISLPISINAENEITNTATAFLIMAFETLLYVWKIKVGITLNTSNVVDDG